MKKNKKVFVFCLCLFFCILMRSAGILAAESASFFREEEFDMPKMSEEIDALICEPPGQEKENAKQKITEQKKAQLYRLLKKDAALSDYQPDVSEQVYDPRVLGNVTPVRFQRFNTCWAFSSLGAGESSLVSKGLSGAMELDLSEAQLTYFFYHSVPDPLGNTAGDGNHNISGKDFTEVGSNTIFSTFALANWVGAAKEEIAPFDGLESGTQYPDTMAYADMAHLQNAYWINFKDIDAVNVIKQMIQKYGAVAINFYWSYRYYNGGSYAYYFPLDSSQPNNHSVTIVGWDDAFSKENFQEANRPQKDGAWIVKNSYGPLWGDGGYFYLSYEDSAVNSGNTSVNRARAYVFDFELAGNYDYNYQYDGSAGAFNATNPDSPLTKLDSGGAIANVFQVKEKGKAQAEVLKAVSFALFDTAVSYRIQIYKNPTDDANPASGTPMLTSPVTGGVSYAGYYTIPIEEPVILHSGDVFAIVAAFEKESGREIEFFADKSYQNGNWISFTNEVKQKESFRRVGGAWEDLFAYGMTARLKAFTNAIGQTPAERVVLMGVEQDEEGKNVLELWAGETYALEASVYPMSASQDLQWETSNALVAEVAPDGILKPKKAGIAVITARTSDGSGVRADLTVKVLQKAKQIALSSSSLELNAGDAVILTAKLLPEGAEMEEIAWSSTGDAVTVDSSGRVEAVKEGSAKVKAYLCSNESVEDVCKIRVILKEPESEPESEQNSESESKRESEFKNESEEQDTERNVLPAAQGSGQDAGANPGENPVLEQNGASAAKITKSAKTSDALEEKKDFWKWMFILGLFIICGSIVEIRKM